jgi:hypothetical protein
MKDDLIALLNQLGSAEARSDEEQTSRSEV